MKLKMSQTIHFPDGRELKIVVANGVGCVLLDHEVRERGPEAQVREVFHTLHDRLSQDYERLGYTLPW